MEGASKGRWMRWLVTIAVVASLLLALAAPSSGARLRVRAVKLRWRPAHAYIAKGDVVVWINNTKRRHTVVAYGGNWSKNVLLKSGERTRKRFRRVGLYKYRCTLHSGFVEGSCRGMCGLVHVTKS